MCYRCVTTCLTVECHKCDGSVTIVLQSPCEPPGMGPAGVSRGLLQMQHSWRQKARDTAQPSVPAWMAALLGLDSLSASGVILSRALCQP